MKSSVVFNTFEASLLSENVEHLRPEKMREKERDRDRQRDREKERERKKERKREREKERKRENFFMIMPLYNS